MAGCTLIVDADSGWVRYQIERATTAKSRAEPAQNDILTRAGSARGVRPPAERQLRVFAFDPSLGVKLETSGINEVVLSYSVGARPDPQGFAKGGPLGEYIEVVDRDPASGCFYSPVDLNDPHLLAQNGLAPSESNPQFHQQMVYAVAMRTIHHFESTRASGALVAGHGRAGPDGRLHGATTNSCRAFGSIRTPCARLTLTTARPRKRCSSVTFRRRG